MNPKDCPADKILNPLSNRCVSRTAKLGRDILAQQMKPMPIPVPPQPKQPQPKQPQPNQPKPVQEKKCADDKILNTLTNRCVSRTAKLGKEIIKQMTRRRASSQSPALSGQTTPQPPNQAMVEKQKGVIGRFMQRTKHARKATFLNAICPKSGVCIAFGTESEKIKQFFNGFGAFDYVSKFVSAGSASSNGFVYAITYTHRGYSANAILKSSKTPRADNLMYEYAVGRQVNQLFYNKYPIFVETYDYYYTYSNEATWKAFQSRTYAGSLKDALVRYEGVDAKTSCKKSKHLCILIQHINNAPSFGNELTNSSNFRKYELLNALYQIYFTLSAIKTQFTHYDLHTGNVLIYTPEQTKYIKYDFHTILVDTI